MNGYFRMLVNTCFFYKIRNSQSCQQTAQSGIALNANLTSLPVSVNNLQQNLFITKKTSDQSTRLFIDSSDTTTESPDTTTHPEPMNLSGQEGTAPSVHAYRASTQGIQAGGTTGNAGVR